MAVYAFFFVRSAIDPTKLFEAVGDRSVIRLDGRRSIVVLNSIAHEECLRRKYDGFQIMKGSSLVSAKPIGRLWPVDQKPVDQVS